MLERTLSRNNQNFVPEEDFLHHVKCEFLDIIFYSAILTRSL